MLFLYLENIWPLSDGEKNIKVTKLLLKFKFSDV